MNRLLILAGVMLLSVTNGWGQIDRRPDVQKHGLKGTVRAVTQVQSPISNRMADWIDGYSGENFTEEYNRKGLLVKRIARDDYNQPHQATYFEYNERGELTKRTEEPLSLRSPMRTTGSIYYQNSPEKNTFVVIDKRVIGSKPVNSRSVTQTDSVRRMQHVQVFSQDTLLVSETYRYWDDQKNTIREINRYNQQEPGPSLPPRSEFADLYRQIFGREPNEQENKTIDSLLQSRERAERLRMAMGPQWSSDTVTYRNQYDGQQRLIRQERWLRGRLAETKEVRYGNDTTFLTRRSFDRKGELSSEQYEEQHPVSKAILKSRSRMKMDDGWNEQTVDARNYPVPHYIYKHDSHGNWIERKQVDDNGTMVGTTLVRTIDYY